MLIGYKSPPVPYNIPGIRSLWSSLIWDFIATTVAFPALVNVNFIPKRPDIAGVDNFKSAVRKAKETQMCG